MPDFAIYAGDTNKTIYVRLRDSTTGLAKTGLLYNSAGAVASYTLPLAARAAITLATQTVTGAHSDGGFVEVDATNCKGLYRLDLPDAAIASGDYTIVSIEFDGIIEESIEIPLHTRKVNVTEWLGTAAATPTVAGVPEVDITHLLGTAWLTPGTAGTPDVNMKLISDDATAADNMELMYDGNGYVDPSAPSSRSQVDAIGATTGGAINIEATEDNTGGAIIGGVTFVGSVQSGTFASTEAEDGVLHDIDDTANDIDIVYGFSVGGGRTGSSITFAGFVQGNSDEMKIKVYDHVGAAWDIIGTIPGQNGTINLARTPKLLLKHTGTGSELGKVYIRFDTDSTTPSNLSVDQLVVAAVNIGQSVGYSLGRIWVNTVGGVAGVEPYVNGVADKPCASWGNVKSLVSSIGVTDIHVVNGSTITPDSTVDNYSFFGDNWTLGLGGQSADDSYFQGANVSGVGTAATGEMHFEGCDVGVASVQGGHFDFCGFDGTVTHTLAGDYNYHDCYSKVPGAGTPIFTKTAGQTITTQFRRWSGSVTQSGIESGDVSTISGELGVVTLNGANGTVKIIGTYEDLVDNRTGSPTLITDGAIKGVDVASILIDTAEIGTAGAGLSNISLPATGLDLILKTSTFALAMADANWDEVISKATHDVAGSAAKTLRQSGDIAQIDGSVSDVSPTTTSFNTDLTQADTYFDDALLLFTNGAANAGISMPVKAFLNLNGNVTFETTDAWPVTPVNGDDFVIYAIHVHPVSQIAEGFLNQTLAGFTTSDTVGEVLNDWQDGGRLDAILDSSAALFTTQLTESYAADGAAPTPAQSLMLIQQALTEFVISGTTITIKEVDGSTTAATLTLDDATSPTSATRST